MQLCLVRHAIAGTPGPRYPDDAFRPLTPRGRRRMRQAAAGLRHLLQPDAIITSPLLRARQTAEILAEAWGHDRVLESRALADGDDEELLRLVNARAEGTVVAVGHMPLLSYTLSWLLTGDPKLAAFQFKKGAAALVAFDGAAEAGAGQLVWLLQPAVLRRLG